MAWDPSTPTASRLVGSGCLTCPPNHRVSGDQGLSALETLSKNILTLSTREFDGPMYPLSELPMERAQTNLVGGEDFTLDYDYHIPNLHDISMHDPTPTRQLADRVTEALNNCGPDSILSNAFEMSSLGCNPPRGRTGVMGKDAAPVLSRVAPLEMGPYCVTMFSNFDHLKAMFHRMESHYPNAAMQVMNYQKIRDFISSNYNLTSALEGQTTPRFSQFEFQDRPTSHGSLEWFSEVIDRVSSHSSSREDWKVSMSRRLFKRWIRDYAEANGITLNADFSNINAQIAGYTVTSNSADSVTLTSDRLNARYTIDFTKDPIYVTDNEVGVNEYEWNFQPWFITRPGDDSRSGEAAGFVRDKNPNYGAACSACPDGIDSLSEMILIYNGESHAYEAFPSSPFDGLPELAELETNLQNLWSSLNFRYYFGSEVQEYFLNPLYAGTGNCPSNIDNTWFAARMWFSYRMRLKRKRAAGACMVKVPQATMANPAADECPTEPNPTPIVLSPRTPEGGSRECVEIDDEEIVDPEGCLRPQASLTIVRPEEDTEYEIEVDRVNGLATDLTVDYEKEDGTAEAGTDYDLDDDTLTVEEGQTRSVITFTVLGAECVDPEEVTTKRFKVLWTGDDLCPTALTETIIDIQDRPCGEGETPS